MHVVDTAASRYYVNDMAEMLGYADAADTPDSFVPDAFTVDVDDLADADRAEHAIHRGH